MRLEASTACPRACSQAWCVRRSSRWCQGWASSSPTSTLPTSSASHAAALALAGFAAVAVFQALGLYNVAALAAAHRQLPRLLLGWTATVAMLLAGVFFLKIAPDFSRAWLALWYAAGAVALVAYRGVVA